MYAQLHNRRLHHRYKYSASTRQPIRTDEMRAVYQFSGSGIAFLSHVCIGLCDRKYQRTYSTRSCTRSINNPLRARNYNPDVMSFKCGTFIFIKRTVWSRPPPILSTTHELERQLTLHTNTPTVHIPHHPPTHTLSIPVFNMRRCGKADEAWNTL